MTPEHYKLIASAVGAVTLFGGLTLLYLAFYYLRAGFRRLKFRRKPAAVHVQQHQRGYPQQQQRGGYRHQKQFQNWR